MALMYDGITWQNLLALNPTIVAGYIDGRYVTNFSAFPNAQHVTITVFGAPGAHVCDCESGDLGPAQAAAWAHNEIANGRRPTIYCNMSTYPSVGSALGNLGLRFGRDLDCWVADYDNNPAVPTGFVAKQFSTNSLYDTSETVSPWPAPPVAAAAPTPQSGGAPATAFVGITSPDNGYWLASNNGGVYSFGENFFNSLPGQNVSVTNIVGIAAHGNTGYWLVGADGGVFCFGSAGFHGSLGGVKLNAPIVGMAPTPSGNGYYLVAEDGGVFCFGDCTFRGSMGGTKLNAPMVGISVTASGYRLFGADGSVFDFGPGFYGSAVGTRLNAPIVAGLSTASGNGYWLFGADGGVFCFGDAVFYGSLGGLKLNAPIAGAAKPSSGQGYWLVGKDGGVFSFGNVRFLGAG